MSSLPPQKKVTIRPAPTHEERDRAVMRWAQVVDQLDFLAILRLPKTERGPSEADVRRAYRTFARGFHPDHYRTSPPAVRDAAAKVFSAGAEAYQVLMEPLTRLRYIKALSEGRIRVPPEELEKATREDKRAAGQLTVSLVKTPAAKKHAEKADKMIALGELAYAKSALEQALALEPGNAALAAKLTAVEERLYAPRGGRR